MLCTCRSHCGTYDQQTGNYHGGQYINRKSAFLHRRDDARSTNLDKFSTRVASSVLGEPSLLGLPSNAQELSSLFLKFQSQELFTLEKEIRDRVSWTPTRRPLVFAKDLIPDTAYENPLLSPDYLPNAGICTLDTSHPHNTAFIENESRLFEIRMRLEQLKTPRDTCEELSDQVSIGQQRMMEHKGDEWDRQRLKSKAAASGLVVVDTGEKRHRTCLFRSKLKTLQGDTSWITHRPTLSSPSPC